MDDVNLSGGIGQEYGRHPLSASFSTLGEGNQHTASCVRALRWILERAAAATLRASAGRHRPGAEGEGPALQVSPRLKFKGIFLCTVGILFHVH